MGDPLSNMPNVRLHSVVWVDKDGEEHSQTFYIDPDITTPAELKERGREIAQRNDSGFEKFLCVYSHRQPKLESCFD